MSRHFRLRAVLAAASVLAVAASNNAGADAITIDPAQLTTNNCFNQAACALEGVDITTSGGVLQKKDLNGASGFGVSGGASGPEIDIGQKLRVDFSESRHIVAIKVLFLFNGPEHSDRAEKARVIADGTDYTLAILDDVDDASATWSGPGTVSKCGAATLAGTGCFIITNPFAGDVDRLDFTAVTGSTPYAGTGTNDSDYSIGYIDVAAQTTLNLVDCAAGCEVDTGFDLSNMQVQNPGGSTEARVIPVELPDCRYVPQACLALLPPVGDSAATDDAARGLLIGLGVIKTLDPTGPNKLNPAAQMLNVTPLLPAEVTSLFDTSGVPPDGLAPLYIAARWRGQSVNDYRIKGYFFKTDANIEFSDVFDGLIDVSDLTGGELGCEPDLGNLLAWDVITTVPELAITTGGRHVDTPINVGCINPTKIKGTRLSLYSVNTEIVPDTWGPTIQSTKPLVTVNNDAVFARLVQALWKDIGDIRANYACKQADPVPSGGQSPLAPALCKTLASLWSQTDRKVKACVDATFKPITGYALGICEQAREYVDGFAAALPATTSRPDPYNRLGELHGRTEVFKHVWDTRFLLSLEPAGFCRERNACAP